MTFLMLKPMLWPQLQRQTGLLKMPKLHWMHRNIIIRDAAACCAWAKMFWLISVSCIRVLPKKQVLNSGFMRLRFISTIFRCRETVRAKPKRNWSFRNSSRWIRIWLLWLTGKCGQLMLSAQPKRQIAMPLPKCGFLTFMRGKICRQIKNQLPSQ